MADKKSEYKIELTKSHPDWLVSDNVPTPDPDKGHSQDQNQPVHRQKEFTVKKLIAFMKADEK
jgi:hypothetical protein